MLLPSLGVEETSQHCICTAENTECCSDVEYIAFLKKKKRHIDNVLFAVLHISRGGAEGREPLS